MKLVGVTGPMGAGKSTVCRALHAMGAEVYECDTRAKSLMQTDAGLRAKITAMLGAEAYFEGGVGELNRAFVAERIFRDNQLRTAVEAAVHTAVAHDIKRWAEGLENREECEPLTLRKHYAVVESAVLVGSPIERVVDTIVLVGVNAQEGIERVVRRDGLTPQQIQQRLSAQLPFDTLKTRAHYTLMTSDTELLTPKIVLLDKFLLSLPPNNH